VSCSLRKMKLLPILMVFNFSIQVPLDGLAKRKPLASLSEKRVTTKVRESLKQKFNGNRVSVSCEASYKKGIWNGHGTLNRDNFTWCVFNGYSHKS
jgi:hypothetical protein